MASKRDVKRQILEILEKSDGLTITDVSRMLNIHYTTASKYLAVLEAEKNVVHRAIGMAKVFKVTGK
jgi:predicted transcriptional regulator